MNAETHTPGPWTHEEHGRTISSPTGCICELHSWMGGDEATANGKIVSAAPDMLAALKELRRWVGDGDKSDDSGLMGYFTPEYLAAISLVDAAIAKAEGGKDGNAG